MRTMRIKKAFLAGFLACCLASLSTAQAAIVELNFDLEISEFSVASGAVADAPFDPVFLSFSVSFDDTSDILDSTAGLTASASIPTAAAIAYTYLASNRSFFLGVTNNPESAGTVGTVRQVFSGTNDWGLIIGLKQAEPFLDAFFYSTEGAVTLWRSVTLEQVTSEVPEPGVLALFGVGLIGMGFARRRRT